MACYEDVSGEILQGRPLFFAADHFSHFFLEWRNQESILIGVTSHEQMR